MSLSIAKSVDQCDKKGIQRIIPMEYLFSTQFSVMASQKWTVFFASLVLVAFMVETKLSMASERTLKSKTICENEKATIGCLDGENIEVIEASYGRHNLYQCPSTDPSVENTECHAENSLCVVQSICDHKPSCELYANNSVFGDPCFGTYKYLEIKFQCAEPPKAIFICENQKHTISCQDGKLIHVVQASYGRQDYYICRLEGDIQISDGQIPVHLRDCGWWRPSKKLPGWTQRAGCRSLLNSVVTRN
ncbi:hypothetical protein ACROYT_G008177 [Oculina patagonica]